MTVTGSKPPLQKLVSTALLLSLITIIYNIAEGLLSVYFGASDESLALLGFGADSFVEVLSGMGIAHMVIRMRKQKVSSWDRFERQALRVTGIGFLLLAAGLAINSVMNIISKSKPETTIAGIIISLISVITMWLLLSLKLKTGRALGSDALIADAACTRTCLYLSVVLLVSCGLYELFRISYLDIAGALAIAGFAFHEGKEALEKARKNRLICCN
jgi:divalent metal cation (Fe/Co/Zn/Cd) transporter